jgi:periplasmic protein TonB
MSIELGPGTSPDSSSQNDFGSLQGCFVEGTPEQRARERRVRRRALIISVAAQAAILTAIVLVPLFAKPERIFANMTPIPPYYHTNAPEHPSTTARPNQPRQHNTLNPVFAQPNRIPPTIDETPDPEPPGQPGVPTGPGESNPCVGCITLDDNRRQPDRPTEVTPRTPTRVFKGHLEQAMLIHRIEPAYPPLAKQIHKEGQVELRAVIATDGTIQSLQVVRGDALFLQSATDAVSQWRYRPTILNGQPVEIETYITVIYTLQH